MTSGDPFVADVSEAVKGNVETLAGSVLDSEMVASFVSDQLPFL